MSVLNSLAQTAATHHLEVFGHCEIAQADDMPDAKALVLLGPAGPGFWPHVQAQPEFFDTAPNPLDRWSKRVIGAIAATVDGQAIMPFGGPPWHPFINWAKRSGRAWQSPVTLLVHDHAGLMASYRGAVAVPQALPTHRSADPPCATCAAQPCRTACPADALTTQGYDVFACHAFLDTDAGQDCMERGCAVRRACPVSKAYGRSEPQSSWHMRIFHP